MSQKPNFSKISKIQVDKKESWSKACFLTLDIDWASDEVLNYTVDLLEKMDVEATWFVTHNTKVLARLRENPKFELGIHPNFNFLLQGDSRNGTNATEVIERMMKLVPEATAVRSHSMTQNTGLLQLFKDAGLTHDCNQFIPEQAHITLKPWISWNGLIRIPYFWEDDVHCIYGNSRPMNELANLDGLKVFDFHPIHVFLNTEHLDRYSNSRAIHNSALELEKIRHDGVGTCSLLTNLIKGTASCA